MTRTDIFKRIVKIINRVKGLNQSKNVLNVKGYQWANQCYSKFDNEGDRISKSENKGATPLTPIKTGSQS